MVDLIRTVRFCIAEGQGPAGGSEPAYNTFAGYPSMRGLGRYYELDVECRGKVEPASGYFLNIKTIDQAVRRHGVPLIERACRETPEKDPALVLREVLVAVDGALGGQVQRVGWKLTPYYCVSMAKASLTTPEARACITQQFDFAAAHRLHSPRLSDEQNRSTFGKCNNPSGHGHNYRVEPCVETPLGIDGAAFTLADLERVTFETIIERFDHKHLNVDCAEFDAARGGLNPTVENIARVFYGLLEPAVTRACAGARLVRVTVWETDKTRCAYPSDA